MENAVTKREKISYGLYFMGQNVFYGLIGYMTTYFTDIGITAALVAIVALITKVWDAINDPIFGMIMDKVNFKKGKFLPWLRMSVIAIPVATILLFIIPTGIPMMAKIIWATLAYMLWDTAYTMLVGPALSKMISPFSCCNLFLTAHLTISCPWDSEGKR